MGHGYENTSILEIRKILREQYNVDEETLKQTKKPLVELLLAYNENAAKIKKKSRVDEEYIQDTITGGFINSDSFSKEDNNNELGVFENIIRPSEMTIKDLGEMIGINVDNTENNTENNTEDEEYMSEDEEESDELTTLDNTALPSFNDLEIDVQDDGLVSIPEFESSISREPFIQDKIHTSGYLVKDEQMVEEKQVVEVPRMFDEGWTDYVLSLLRENEKFESYPKLKGLRRLTEELIGPIKHKILECIKCPDGTYDGATIKVRIECKVTNKKHPSYNSLIIEESIADAHSSNNSVSPFCYHMSTIAESRAESRCYKNILNINTVTAEEVNSGMNVETNSNEQISQVQIMALDLIAKRNNLSVFDYINSGASGKKYSSINDISKDTALKMIEVMNKIASGETERPENVGDYDPAWMSK